ncbi:unnamed protein product [Notodromas monacha]|uniref:C2H2-type domain-containing protein n=1 Tax=Notodromas monacha TaxID=399045 RepID=A0A7R9BDY4_9CRUS|nr:unnamed protein product [Notodromas monacha]CAG0912392.1 unnamed protein product [Notodromas monacha]
MASDEGLHGKLIVRGSAVQWPGRLMMLRGAFVYFVAHQILKDIMNPKGMKGSHFGSSPNFERHHESEQRAASHMGAEGGSGVVNRKRLSKRLSESGGDTGVAGGGGVPVGQNERTGGSEVGDLEDSAIQSAARVVERGRYECSICTTVCVDRQGFADHLFGFHLGIARFFCRFCDKKFYYRPKVYEHIREAHSKNVAGKKKKGVVPFLYQIEPDAKVKLMTFLKGRDGRDGATAVELHCLGSRVAGVRRQRGGKSTGKPKAVKPGGPKALFPCHWCDKEFTAQSYLDRHVKKGGCNRRRGKLRAATPVEHTGNGATHTPSPTNCSPSPTATPTPSPASSASQPSIRSPLSNSSSDGGSAGNSGFRQPFQPRGGPNTQQSVVADSGQRHAVSASTPYFQHFNHPHPPRQPGDDPESYVLLEL